MWLSFYFIKYVSRPFHKMEWIRLHSIEVGQAYNVFYLDSDPNSFWAKKVPAYPLNLTIFYVSGSGFWVRVNLTQHYDSM